MATKMTKKSAPAHPPYAEMVCEALMTLDKAEGEKHHGHGVAAIKKAMEDKYKLHAGFEKHLNQVIKMMVEKKQLTHMPGHVHTYQMSHTMKDKMEHKMERREKKAKAPKKKMAKGKSPAKRAKKADMTKTK